MRRRNLTGTRLIEHYKKLNRVREQNEDIRNSLKRIKELSQKQQTIDENTLKLTNEIHLLGEKTYNYHKHELPPTYNVFWENNCIGLNCVFCINNIDICREQIHNKASKALEAFLI